jgi:2-polyprenyl-6-methoxyphenol hydroxylase-like FAD-dependent oxidoreductase
MKVLIVGAGIGGLTLAIFLKEQGHDVQIIEKSKKLTNAGFSIGVWANRRFILKALDLEKELLKKGNFTKRYIVEDSKGKILVDYDLKKNMPKYWPAEIQIKRDDLYQALFKKVKGIPFRKGVTVQSIVQDKDEAHIVFSDKSKGKYDLIVGADGIHSDIRNQIYGKRHLEDLNLKGYWLWIKRPKLFPKFDCIFEVIAPNQFFGTYSHGKDNMCAYFVRPRNDKESISKSMEVGEMDLHFSDILSRFPEISQSLKKQTVYVENISKVNLERWHKGRVVLIGDAAHGFETFAGIGGAMAMEDAYVLAEEIKNNGNLKHALKKYESRRKPRVNLAAKETEKLRSWKVSKSAFEIELEELILPFVPLNYFTEEYEKLLSTEA